jgi:hypothetical protein
MNGVTTGVSNAVLAGAATSGLLYHMARDYDDGMREYTAYESFASMLRDEYIEGQGNKGYFARMDGVKSVSFTGSSVARLSKLVSRRSPFGICFEKRIIDPFGTDIKPVSYISQAEIDRIKYEGIYPGKLTAAERYWIDLNEPGKYEFSWEEEWRKLGDLMFDHGSVVFLIVPISHISAELYATGHPIIPSDAIWNPIPHLQRVAKLVELARGRAADGEEIDETSIEDGYLVWLSYKFQELYDEDFYPKIRAEMNRDIEREIFTDSGEIRDPNGEGNIFEASSFDLDNMLDEIFEDGE